MIEVERVDEVPAAASLLVEARGQPALEVRGDRLREIHEAIRNANGGRRLRGGHARRGGQEGEENPRDADEEPEHGAHGTKGRPCSA